MSVELNSKFLKLSLNDSKVNADFGNGIVLKSDTQTVKDALTSVVGAIGVENCMKVGGAAAATTALFVAAKSLSVKWPWLKTTNVMEDNVLEVAVPPKKEVAFKKIFESGLIERVVQDNFEDLESNLEGILGEEVNDKVGESVLELIQDVRVSSVSTPDGHSGTSIVAGNIVEGTYTVNEENVDRVVADASGQASKVAGMIVAKGGTAGGNKIGGKELVVKGSADAIEKLTKAQRGDKIKITVRSDLFEDDFVKEFNATDIVRTVIKALKKARPGHAYQIRRNGALLDENLLTIGQAAHTGSTMNWEAIKKNSEDDNDFLQ